MWRYSQHFFFIKNKNAYILFYKNNTTKKKRTDNIHIINITNNLNFYDATFIQYDREIFDYSNSLLRANGLIFFQNFKCRSNLEVAHCHIRFNQSNVMSSFFAVSNYISSMFLKKTEHKKL